MRVRVDPLVCEANGVCEQIAPDVFELGDDDVLKWVEEPDESLRPKVEQAVAACPVQAITLED